MKIQILGACFALVAPLAVAQTAKPKAVATSAYPKRTLNVAVLIYPGMNALDATGPLEVFDMANDLAPGSFNFYTLASTHAPVAPHGNAFSLAPRFSFADAPRADIVVVPGAPMPIIAQLEHNAALLNFVREAAKKPQLMSVCTGSFLLARAGVLDGKRVTTHFGATADFAQQFPRVILRQNLRFVEDGNVLTTAGVSSGIDGALQVVEKARGRMFADAVARGLQYRPHTPAFPLVTVRKTPLHNAMIRPGQKLALDYDPVCHMKVNANDKITFAWKGQIYGFCSPTCRDQFADHPGQFLGDK